MSTECETHTLQKIHRWWIWFQRRLMVLELQVNLFNVVHWCHTAAVGLVNVSLGINHFLDGFLGDIISVTYQLR